LTVLVAVLAVALGASIIALSNGPTSKRLTPSAAVHGRDFFGLNVGHLEWPGVATSDVADALGRAQQLGAKWVRVGVQWSDVQRDGPSTWDWSGPDKVIDQANVHGLHTLALLTYSPKWAIPERYRALPQKNDWERYPPTDVQDFARFAKAAAAHYRAKGVASFEIWNEANCQYWNPAPNASDYVRLLSAASTAIKQVAKDLIVVSSGLAPYGQYGESTSDCVNPLTFLQQMYMTGARGTFDALGWHPNNWTSGSPTQSSAKNAFYQMYGTVPNAFSIMADHVDVKKIWMTEFGYPTGDSTAVTYNDETLQSKYLEEGYRVATSAAWAGPLFWFDQRDDSDLSFGLHRNMWSKKPAWERYHALALAAGRHNSCCK
jgi:hypothetical protein